MSYIRLEKHWPLNVVFRRPEWEGLEGTHRQTIKNRVPTQWILGLLRYRHWCKYETKRYVDQVHLLKLLHWLGHHNYWPCGQDKISDLIRWQWETRWIRHSGFISFILGLIYRSFRSLTIFFFFQWETKLIKKLENLWKQIPPTCMLLVRRQTSFCSWLCCSHHRHCSHHRVYWSHK